MVWSNNHQDFIWSPCGARAGVRAPHGNLRCSSYPTGSVRGPCGTHKAAVRRPYGHVRELTQPEFAKIPHGRRMWPYGPRTGPVRSPHGLFMGCLWYLNPYGARKLIMHALKLYGPRTGRQNSYGATRAPYGPPWVDVRFLFKTAREQPVRDPGVWCDWGNPKQLERHGCVFSSTIDVLVIKHQAISTHSADCMFIFWNSFMQTYCNYRVQC